MSAEGLLSWINGWTLLQASRTVKHANQLDSPEGGPYTPSLAFGSGFYDIYYRAEWVTELNGDLNA